MIEDRAADVARDSADRLAPLRERFDLPEGVIYLDGNSLGALPSSTAARVDAVIHDEWGRGLIRSWNDAGWIDAAARVGDKIARLIGARPGEVVATDSTSVNLFKVLSAAIDLQSARYGSGRIVSERGNFPTDLYIAQTLARARGWTLELVETDCLGATIAASASRGGILMLTHVDYRSGRMHDLAALTRAAHAADMLVLWDLAHSAGAVPVDLHAADADIAIGCGYKYLNGGPGAPAFVWVHPRCVNRTTQPLAGWMGHAAPFAFDTTYRPADGIQRYLTGTPSIIALAALSCGVDSILAADPFGGMTALRAKSVSLTDRFIALVDAACPSLTVVSPRNAAERGSQVSLTTREDGYAIVQALAERGVIADFRAGDGASPDILRFGFAPLYIRYADVWDAVAQLAAVLDTGEWRAPRFSRRATVT